MAQFVPDIFGSDVANIPNSGIFRDTAIGAVIEQLHDKFPAQAATNELRDASVWHRRALKNLFLPKH
jgi:hypothetical protein